MDRVWVLIEKELHRRFRRAFTVCRWRHRGQGALAVLLVVLACQQGAVRWLG